MKTLADIPDYIKQTLTTEEKEALRLLEAEAKDLTAFFQEETLEFDCIGFIGPGNKVTKFAELDKYIALLILEDRIRKELNGENTMSYIGGF
jgi:hypothetical protein